MSFAVFMFYNDVRPSVCHSLLVLSTATSITSAQLNKIVVPVKGCQAGNSERTSTGPAAHPICLQLNSSLFYAREPCR